MEQKEALLSICISSYNHKDNCVKLVQNILRIEDNRINIYVCDDASTDGTVDALRKIQDSRLRITQNSTNLGPCKNWYQTLNCKMGTYILHVLDRDTLNVKILLLLLNFLIKYEIVGGYIGMTSAIEIIKKCKVEKGIYIYQKGKEALLAMGGIPVHPTGFLIRRKTWEQLNIKKYFYNTLKYGIYPHAYVLGHAALKGNMVYLSMDFYSYRYTGVTKKSRFYTKEKNNSYYWLPSSVISVGNRLVIELCKSVDKLFIDEFLYKRFCKELIRATIVYRATVKNYKEMQHYGLAIEDISRLQIIIIAIYCGVVYNSIVLKYGIKKMCVMKAVWEEILIMIKEILI